MVGQMAISVGVGLSGTFTPSLLPFVCISRDFDCTLSPKMAKRNTRSNSSAPPRGHAQPGEHGNRRKKQRSSNDGASTVPAPVPAVAGIGVGGAVAALGRAGANLLGLSTPAASARSATETPVQPVAVYPPGPPPLQPVYVDGTMAWQRHQATEAGTAGMPPLPGTTQAGRNTLETRDSPSTITASTMASHTEKQAVVELNEQEQNDHETWVKSDIKLLAKARLRKVLIRYGKFVMGKQGNIRAEERFKNYMRDQLRLPNHEFDKLWDGTIRDTLVEHSRDLRHEFTKKMKLRYFGT